MNKKLKIAIIGSRGYPYVYSGYETLVKELSERLVLKGHLVRVYCHRSLFRKKPREVNGIELIYTPSIETKNLSQFINSFFSFFHVCFSNTDIVLVVNSANGPFGILTKIFQKKTCINVDGLEWLRPKWNGLGSIYFKISSKLSTVLFDKIITDSHEMNRVYKREFNCNSSIVAYGSTMVKNIKLDYLKKYKLKPKSYYLIVGRLIPDNNAKLIVEGFIKSKTKKKLVIVGDVPYQDRYAMNIKALSSKNIIFTGYIKEHDELNSFFQHCYGYIHGHEYGGTNPTMINALKLNASVLSLNTVFNKEMLKSKKAIFFQKNIKSIVDNIILFEKLYNQTKYINIDYQLPKIYDWEFITNKYLKIFFSITNYQNK